MFLGSQGKKNASSKKRKGEKGRGKTPSREQLDSSPPDTNTLRCVMNPVKWTGSTVRILTWTPTFSLVFRVAKGGETKVLCGNLAREIACPLRKFVVRVVPGAGNGQFEVLEIVRSTNNPPRELTFVKLRNAVLRNSMFFGEDVKSAQSALFPFRKHSGRVRQEHFEELTEFSRLRWFCCHLLSPRVFFARVSIVGPQGMHVLPERDPLWSLLMDGQRPAEETSDADLLRVLERISFANPLTEFQTSRLQERCVGSHGVLPEDLEVIREAAKVFHRIPSGNNALCWVPAETLIPPMVTEVLERNGAGPRLLCLSPGDAGSLPTFAALVAGDCRSGCRSHTVDGRSR
jgi:hypothetical protein